MAYVGEYAYERLTGRSVYDDTDLAAFQVLRDELGKEIVYKDGIQYPREPRDLPAFLPKLCAKHGGSKWFNVQPSAWNYEIRKLLDAGKLLDLNKATKKKKSNQRGEPR